MKRSSPNRAVAALSIALVLLAGSAGLGQQLSGAQSGTLAVGVYDVNGQLSVSPGQTFTIPAGAILKFRDGVQFDVYGTLIVNGTAGQPVYFTAFTDDSVGGDTNANGPSSGNPDDWRGIRFHGTSDASVITRAVIRFCGDNFFPNVDIIDSNLSLTNCTIASGSRQGLYLNNSSAAPTITGCAFNNNAGPAIDGARLELLAGISNNTATGNAGGNFIRIVNGAVTANTQLGPQNCLGGALWFANHISVAPSVTLTLLAGAILKFQDGVQGDVYGTLVGTGTPASPVVFTSTTDDVYGGDTNLNGAVPANPDDWRGLRFHGTSDASTLTSCIVRFGGDNFFPQLDLVDASITLTNCTIANGSRQGVYLNNSSSNPTITGCTFSGNALQAIDGARLDFIGGITNNTATGNAGGNFIRIVNAGIGTNTQIGPQHCLGGSLWFANHLSIPVGVTLTFTAGTILKFQDGVQGDIYGTLVTTGTESNPVVITSTTDDVYGGDTNLNGGAAANPDDWRGLRFHSTSDASSLSRAIVRFGGDNFFPQIDIIDSDLTIADCTIESGSRSGINLNNAGGHPSVVRTTIRNNAGPAVDLVPIDAVPGFVNNSATGNAGGNFLRIATASVTGTVAIGPENCLGGALWMANHLSVGGAGRLIVRAGTVVKWQDGVQGDVFGGIDLLGTAREPVVFTSTTDDSWAGDTNLNGPIAANPDDWRGLRIHPSATTSLIENALFRYTGDNFFEGISNASPNVKLRSIRVDRGSQSGIVATAHDGDAVNWVAWGCAGSGIVMNGGAFPLVHPTAASCGTGINVGPWTGTIYSGISWSNAGANYSGIGGARLQNCDGLVGVAGSNGNIHLDPQFVDINAGNLRLSAGSPCLNAANIPFALSTVKDWDENSRGLDHNLTGAMLPDMGAFERAAYVMSVTGVPRIGTSMGFVVNGTAGQSIYAIGPLDGTLLTFPYGFITAGLVPSLVIFPNQIPTGTGLGIDIPNDPSLLGVSAGLQTLTYPNTNPSVGNITALVRVTFRR